jgi:hypothetical protein
MRNPVDIDSSHSRAIVREIGEKLRLSLKEHQEVPENFRKQIERIRQTEARRRPAANEEPGTGRNRSFADSK